MQSTSNLTQPDEPLEWDPYCLGSVEGHFDSSLSQNHRRHSRNLWKTLNVIKTLEEAQTLIETLDERLPSVTQVDKESYEALCRLEGIVETVRVTDFSLCRGSEVQGKLKELLETFDRFSSKHKLKELKLRFEIHDTENRMFAWKFSKFLECLDSTADSHIPGFLDGQIKWEQLEVACQRHTETVQNTAEDWLSFKSLAMKALHTSALTNFQQYQLQLSALDKLQKTLSSLTGFQLQLERKFLHDLEMRSDTRDDETTSEDCAFTTSGDFESSVDDSDENFDYEMLQKAIEIIRNRVKSNVSNSSEAVEKLSNISSSEHSQEFDYCPTNTEEGETWLTRRELSLIEMPSHLRITVTSICNNLNTSYSALIYLNYEIVSQKRTLAADKKSERKNQLEEFLSRNYLSALLFLIAAMIVFVLYDNSAGSDFRSLLRPH